MSVVQCSGCEARGELATANGKPFCTACCPQLYCQACLGATGGQCREHMEPECTCYELAGANGAHQPGCPFYGSRSVPVTVVEEVPVNITDRRGRHQPPIDIPSIMRAGGFEEGVKAERARIVAWLRAAPLDGPAETVYADAIEKGKHVR